MGLPGAVLSSSSFLESSEARELDRELRTFRLFFSRPGETGVPGPVMAPSVWGSSVVPDKGEAIEVEESSFLSSSRGTALREPDEPALGNGLGEFPWVWLCILVLRSSRTVPNASRVK